MQTYLYIFIFYMFKKKIQNKYTNNFLFVIFFFFTIFYKSYNIFIYAARASILWQLSPVNPPKQPHKPFDESQIPLIEHCPAYS